MKIEEIEKVAVVGAGIMGHDLALLFSRAGYPVIMRDVTPELVTKGITNARSDLEVFINRGHISKSEASEIMGRITVTTDLEEAVSDADFVTEAVTENLDLKKEIFSEMESYCARETILASNTSGIMMSDISAEMKHPERTIITHYHIPPHIVPVVEVVKGNRTSEGTLEITCDLLKKIGKLPVIIKKEIEGFISNRLQFAMVREAFHLVDEGVADPVDIDLVVRAGFGFRYPTYGPFVQMDQSGLDTYLTLACRLFKNLSNRTDDPESIRKLVAQGKLGVKSGEGFYNYAEYDKTEFINQRDDEFLARVEEMTKRGVFD